MTTPPPPITQPTPSEQPAHITSASIPDGTRSEYENLLSFFKYLVSITTGAISLLAAVGAFFFYSNLREAREEAKQEATRVATNEAKAAVARAFDEKNINDLILVAAKTQVGKVTDKMVQQQVVTRLVPMQNRITLIGQISESGVRMRFGFRAGLNQLNEIINNSTDPDVVHFGRETFTTIAGDYEDRLQEARKNRPQTGLQFLTLAITVSGRMLPQPTDVSDVVKIIEHEEDLNVVAAAFGAFRDLTQQPNIKMFDLASVKAWCSANKSKCQKP